MTDRIVAATGADRTPRELLAPADRPCRDPFEQQWWTQMQVLAWVYLRNPAVVRHIGLLDLVPIRKGRFTIMDLCALAGNGAWDARITNVEEAVIEALQAGRLTAYGSANGMGDLKEIPSVLWADLKFHYAPNCAEPDATRPATPWYDLRFQRQDVLAIWPNPLESLAMADDHNRTPSDTRTGAANATREARKAHRLADLKRFIDDVYEAAGLGDLNLGSGNDRKALPFSTRALRAVFLERHPEHEIKQATFNDDLPQISVKVKPGQKRVTIKYLRTMLAKNNQG